MNLGGYSKKFPTLATKDERAVTLRSVVNYPVMVTGQQALKNGKTGRDLPAQKQATTVAFLLIGTIMKLLPSCRNDGSIILQSKIVIARIVGNEIINGNRYPVPSSSAIMEMKLTSEPPG